MGSPSSNGTRHPASSHDVGSIPTAGSWSPGGIAVTETHKHNVRFASNFPLVLSENHFTPECEVPENYHDYLEVSIVDHGRGYFKVGEHTFPIADGDVILMGPSQLHTVEVPRKSQLFVRSVFFLPGLVFNPGEPDSNFDWLRLFYDQRFRRDPVINDNRTHALSDHFHELVETQEHSPRYRNLEARIALFQILLNALKEFEDQHADEPAQNITNNVDRLDRVLSWMSKNSEDDLSLSAAADVACVSTQYFCRFFKNAVGRTFTEHLSRIRVAHAKQLLLQGNLRTTDIAYEVGFGSQSNFFRTFRRVTGASPQEFLVDDVSRESSPGPSGTAS